ncbi:hypothetical protein GA0061081_101390 [Gilliamella bombicola]|uniref:Uncharacterized protein n=1 Tax=Gilliamella bombicola TaxID=1798182 RepID=A0A1C3ZGG4_9GAMM|nr:hypothetical protein GA0061081_101390 [Gilliamella bombicola]
MPYSFDSQALSAYTSRVIEGSAPYLTYDNGRTKATTTADLLSITLSDNRTFTPSNGSSATNPIVLPVAGQSFTDIHMMVPPSTNSVSLNDLVTSYHYWGDDDGDGQGANGVTATGSLSVAITDKNNRTVGRGTVLSLCHAPYRVVLSSSAGSLITQYGVPNSSTFSGSSATYYITPPPSPTICYARPNLIFGGQDTNTSTWDPTKGHLTQSTDPASYNRNFPTTGADGLYFDLNIAGIDASQLTWVPVTHEGITATVTRVTANDSWLPNGSEVVTRVTLTGPEARSQNYIVSYGSIGKPHLPATFELVGRDSGGRAVIKYGFVLRMWFVHRGSVQENYQGHAIKPWCSSFGYRIPMSTELAGTRGKYGSISHRVIGGLFNEWGNVSHYGVGFSSGRYCTYNRTDSPRIYISPSGSISNTMLRSISNPNDCYARRYPGGINLSGVCVYPTTYLSLQ